MEVNVKLTYKEVENAFSLIRKHKRLKYVVLLTYLFIFPMLFSEGIITLLDEGFSWWNLFWVNLIGFILIFYFLQEYILLLLYKKRTNNNPIRYTFTEDGVNINSEIIKSEYQWNIFKQVIESNKCFLMTVKYSRNFICIPKSILLDDGIVTLRDLLEKHICDYNKKLSGKPSRKFLDKTIGLFFIKTIQIIVVILVVSINILLYMIGK